MLLCWRVLPLRTQPQPAALRLPAAAGPGPVPSLDGENIVFGQVLGGSTPGQAVGVSTLSGLQVTQGRPLQCQHAHPPPRVHWLCMARTVLRTKYDLHSSAHIPLRLGLLLPVHGGRLGWQAGASHTTRAFCPPQRVWMWCPPLPGCPPSSPATGCAPSTTLPSCWGTTARPRRAATGPSPSRPWSLLRRGCCRHDGGVLASWRRGGRGARRRQRPVAVRCQALPCVRVCAAAAGAPRVSCVA